MRLNAEPAYLGIYTTVSSFMTVIVSQKLTGLVDRGVSSKKLFMFSLSAIAVAAVCFSLASEFWHAIVIACLVMPFASSSIPLILTIIRNYADNSGQDSTKLNSQMRSSVSLLWIVGPPLAFLSVEHLGFTTNYYLATFLALLVFCFVGLLFKAPQPIAKPIREQSSNTLPTKIWLLAGIVLLANIGNSTYINAMPLLITQELGMPTSYPGYLLGLTAAVEIPIMLLSVNWARRWGKESVLRVGFISAAFFYIAMYYCDSMPSFLALQLFNGVYFGIFVGLGVTIMQDYAPNNIGKASAIYTNAMLVGTMIGTSTMGVISQYLGYRSTLLLSLAAITCALIALTMFIKAYQESTPTVQKEAH